LTAGVIALGIIAYGVFRIDTENTASVLLVTQDGSRPIMIGGNAISQLIGRAKLETMIFVSCVFKMGALHEDALGNKFDVCSSNYLRLGCGH